MTLGSLAKLLGISVPYLSQIETGSKPLTDDVVDRAIRELGLLGADANELRRAAAVSKSEYAIRLGAGANDNDHLLASMLAAGFARLSVERKNKLREIMMDDTRG